MFVHLKPLSTTSSRRMGDIWKPTCWQKWEQERGQGLHILQPTQPSCRLGRWCSSHRNGCSLHACGTAHAHWSDLFLDASLLGIRWVSASEKCWLLLEWSAGLFFLHPFLLAWCLVVAGYLRVMLGCLTMLHLNQYSWIWKFDKLLLSLQMCPLYFGVKIFPLYSLAC